MKQIHFKTHQKNNVYILEIKYKLTLKLISGAYL